MPEYGQKKENLFCILKRIVYKVIKDVLKPVLFFMAYFLLRSEKSKIKYCNIG